MVVFDSDGLAGTFFPSKKFGSDLVGGYMYLQANGKHIEKQDEIEIGLGNQTGLVPVHVIRALRPGWYCVEPIVTE